MSTALQGPSDERQQPDDARRPLRFLALGLWFLHAYI